MSEAHRLVAINEMTKLMQPYGAVKAQDEMSWSFPISQRILSMLLKIERGGNRAVIETLLVLVKHFHDNYHEVHNICILNPYKILHLSGYIDNIVGMFIRSVLIGNSHIYFKAVVKVRYNTKSGTCSHETLDVYEIMPVLQTNVLPAYPAVILSDGDDGDGDGDSDGDGDTDCDCDDHACDVDNDDVAVHG
ncbi:hypothetical protein GQX74_010100 [Glossina fuscipes]|nr:hypothetical protein GQX74_010100 [Glossina fuscipes]